MALSTRAKLAGLGGAFALGVLGATGVAYAGDGPASPQYVTTVDDGATQSGQPAPADGERPAGKDCPEGSGGRGGGTESPAPPRSESAPATPADA
jgi:hypothetical protein